MTQTTNRTLLAAFLLLIPGGVVQAYVDPGTGSYLFQMSIAILMGGLYSVKLYWRQLVMYLTGSGGGEQERIEDETTSDLQDGVDTPNNGSDSGTAPLDSSTGSD